MLRTTTALVAISATCLLLTQPAPATHEGHEPTTPTAQVKKPNRGPKSTGKVLVFSGTGWYRHPETAAINGWLARLSDDLGMQVDVTEDPKDIRGLLKRYDVLVLNNSNELVKLFDEKTRNTLRDWYRSGGGIVALHAALVHQTEWPWFVKIAGCDFNSDSEFLEARVTVDEKMKNHPSVKGFWKSFAYKADWTNHTRTVTGLPGFKVLLRVDESTFDPVRDYFKTRGGKAMGKDHPVAWLHENDGGRFFYTELGHDVRSLETKFGRQHIVEAIKWAAEKRQRKRAAAMDPLPDLDVKAAVMKSEDAKTLHYMWEVPDADAWASEAVVDSEALVSFRKFVEAKVKPDPVELLRRQAKIFAKAYGKDSPAVQSMEAVMTAKIGRIRKISRLESAILARHAEVNPLDHTDMKLGECSAMVFQKRDRLRVYLSIPKPPLPMGAPQVSLADKHLADGTLKGWQLVSHLHNHPFYFGNKYGDIAGTTVPSGPDISTFASLRRAHDMQQALITNGFHTLVLTPQDIKTLADK